MSLFAIGDTHLSFSVEKPMDIFGGWQDYVTRLEKNWRAVVKDSDIVVIPGDISWAMSLEEALADFRFLDSLPGKKLIMKGNHDYWWSTMNKLTALFENNGISSISMIYNNAYAAENFAVCGTRGWFYDAACDADRKIVRREAGRLQLSISKAREISDEPIVFLHYPPLTNEAVCSEIMDVLKENSIKRCFYGHLHGASTRFAVCGEYEGIDFELVSADFLGFCPKLIEKF